MRRFVLLLPVIVLLSMPASSVGLEKPRGADMRQQTHSVGTEVPNAQVTAGGQPFPARAVRVGGRLFVAGDDLYGHLPGVQTIDGPAGFLVGINNSRWAFVGARISCVPTSPDCEVRGPGNAKGSFPLTAPPMLGVGNRLPWLLPVGDAHLPYDVLLPYLMVHVDGDQVHVAPAADWPAAELPTSIAEAVVIPSPFQHFDAAPGQRREIFIQFRDAKGALIRPVQPFQSRFSVPPDSPLRLAPGPAHQIQPLGPAVTVSRDWPRVSLIVSAEKYVREGAFPITATLPEHGPVKWETIVQDRRPYRLAATINTPVRAGRKATATIRLLDRHWVTADMAVFLNGSPGPVSVEIRGPAGAEKATPQLDTSGPFTTIGLFKHGVAEYHFTPSVPGLYRLTVTGSFSGQEFGVAPWPLRPVTLRFTVTR